MTKTLADVIHELEMEAVGRCGFCCRVRPPLGSACGSCGARSVQYPLAHTPWQVVTFHHDRTISFRCRNAFLARYVARRLAKQWGLS